MSRLGRSFKAGRSSIPPFLSATSFFHRQLGPGDTVASDQTHAKMLANQMYYGDTTLADHSWYGYTGPGYGGANYPNSVGFNGPSTFGAPIYLVRPSDPRQSITRQTVSFYWGSSPTYHHYANLNGLETYLANVPIPSKALCPMLNGTGVNVSGVQWTANPSGGGSTLELWSGGSDSYMAIWNLDTDEWWDFWLLSNNQSDVQAFTGTTWNAGYGGYIPNVSRSNGQFANQWGARACSLSLAAGVITMQDLRDVAAGGTINHALCCASGCTGGSSNYVFPATRSDGTGGNAFPSTIPNGFPNAGQPNPAYGVDITFEGERYRFPAGTTASASTSVTSYPLCREICRAIEKYGFYVVDTTGGVGFFVEDDRTVGSPYHYGGATAPHPWGLTWPGSSPYYGGHPGGVGAGYTVLNNLPWDSLQLLNPPAL